MSAKKLDVAVLVGGWSNEREVSLVSGDAACKAVAELGHNVRRIDVTRDLPALVKALTPKPDVVFNALHGTGGEDGMIQSVLSWIDVPYTHSGVLPSAIAMDKEMTKRVLATAGVRTPQGKVYTVRELRKGINRPTPYIIKPVAEGSSVGIQIVHEGQNSIFNMVTWHYGDALVEDFIPGRELTVGVLNDRALAVTEIVHTTEFFDYTAKYTEGHATHTLPANVPDDVAQAAKDMALIAHRTLGCRGISRSDFRYNPDKPGTEGLYFLEINTQPGFTPLSLVPEQAQHCGIPFTAVVAELIEIALNSHTCATADGPDFDYAASTSGGAQNASSSSAA